MPTVQKPTKEQVREWLKKEVARHAPPPTAKEIRRQLGWHIVTK